MPANLFLHIRSLPSGRVIMTPIPFPDLSQDGATFQEARTAAVKETNERLTELKGSERSALCEPASAELDSVVVEVGDPAFKLTFGLVVVQREGSEGPVHLVYAPEAPNFVAAVADRAAVREMAAHKLAKHVKRWALDVLVACDETGEVELQPLTLPLPETEGGSGSGSSVESAADDLTARASRGELGRLDRRDPLVERVLAALAADGRSSVLLVGPGDVGKTALIDEVAARLCAGEVPPALIGRRLLRLSANELIAGAMYTGQWQERARELVRLSRTTGAIIAMGDPAGIVDAGRWSQSDNNVGRALRPFLEQGELRLICEATEEAVTVTRRLEPSFIEAFYRVEVPEPDRDAARAIVRAAAARIASNHDAVIDDSAVQAAFDLTTRFEPYRAQPGKSVRLLEEAAQMTATDGQGLEREAVTRAFAERTGMPLAMLSDEITLDPGEVRSFFEQRVLGQDEAVDAMVDLILVAKAGINDPGKPLGSFFFVGPTGVGKTELTKALAEFLFGSRDRVLRFDMGEYAGGDAVPRLLGSGWQREGEGELTRRVRAQPFCVVLLDEIEKAHADVFDALLSALGEGRLTNASGETADLRNAIVVMTSNLGAGGRERGGMGFGEAGGESERDRRRAHFVEQAERFFRPEFFNRIDQLIVFDPLDEASIRRIARRELGGILMREGITRRRLLVEVQDGVVEHLAAAGLDPRYGARPLHREIERAVVRPLARLLIAQQPRAGDLIVLHATGGDIALDVHRVREAPRVAPPAAPPTEPSRHVAELRDAAHELSDSASAVTAREALSALVDASNEPGFWDRPDEARAVLARLYELQRIFDDLRALRDRVDGLVGLSAHAARDRTRVGEVRQASGEIEHRLAVLRLELAGAGSGQQEVQLTCAAVGSAGEEWAASLLAMYAAWADRTGREVIQGEGALVLNGLGVGALLAHEAGLHRHELAEGSQATARVTVAIDGTPAPAADSDAAGEVVRVYEEGRRTGVRDPRTGVVVGNVRAVLHEGRIDEFILAGLDLGAG